MYLSAFINGALLGGGLIIAIGAQNMFVLRQGLARDQVFVVVLVSSLIDAALIILGAMGLGSLISAYPLAVTLASMGGAVFLILYGFVSLYRAFRPAHSLDITAQAVTSSFKRAVAMTLAFGLLNPHVYLDTVLLLGGIAAQYEMAARQYFVAGAVAMSFVWFFAIGYGARVLSPLMRHPMGGRILNGAVALMMFSVAFSLIR